MSIIKLRNLTVSSPPVEPYSASNYHEINVKFHDSVGKSKHFFFPGDKCLYVLNSSKKDCCYLRCWTKSCSCRAKIEGGVFSSQGSQQHDHPDHQIQADFEIAYDELKKLVHSSTRPVRELHKEALRSLCPEAAGELNWNMAKHTLYHVRRKRMPPCPDFDTFEALLEDDEVVFETYGKIRQTEFYRGAVGNRALIFGNVELIAFLEPGSALFIDGTFNVTPFRTNQLLIVMADILGRIRPIAYIVHTCRSQKQYTEIFKHLQSMLLDFDSVERKPASVMFDFEKASRRAARVVWPEAEVLGCNFHFCQALRRRAIATFSTAFHGTLHQAVKLLMRLSLLPIELIDEGLDAIKAFIESHRLTDNFSDYMDYFERTWMKSYKPKDWCVCERVHRTNCNTEGYNNTVKSFISSRPGPWTFLQGLQDLGYDASSLLFADKAKKDFIVPDRSKLTQPMNDNLVLLRSGDITVLQFLKNMAEVEEG